MYFLRPERLWSVLHGDVTIHRDMHHRVTRRLHDINKSGWLMLLLIIPLVNLIFMIYLLLARGTDGANRFGHVRPTPGWEKILGYIGIGFMILALVGLLVVLLLTGALYFRRMEATFADVV